MFLKFISRGRVSFPFIMSLRGISPLTAAKLYRIHKLCPPIRQVELHSFASSCSYSTNKTATDENSENIKDFSELPGPKGLPIFGTTLTTLKAVSSHQLHKYFQSRFQKFGPIFHEKLGGNSMVFIHDPDDVAGLFRNEGKYPVRTQFKAWKVQRQVSGQPLGPVLQEGEDWQRLRSALNPHLMKLQKVGAAHTSTLDKVALQAVTRLSDLSADTRSDIGTTGSTDDPIQDMLFNWALESAGHVLLERRLGCLEEKRNEDADMFIKAVLTCLRVTQKLLLIPPEIARPLKIKAWKELTWGFDNIYELVKRYTEEREEAILQKTQGVDEMPTNLGLMASMLENTELTKEDRIGCIMDLLTAAVDTSSNTALWALYQLALNPDAQETARKEVMETMPGCDKYGGGEGLQFSDVNSLRYLKAVVRETLRMYPIASIISRILDHDTVIRGYKIPAKTEVSVMLYSMGRDSQLFDEPELFSPERWLRGDDNKQQPNPFSSLPFGYGHRSCVDQLRNITQDASSTQKPTNFQEMLQRYEIGTLNKDVDVHMRLLLQPSKPVRLTFKPL